MRQVWITRPGDTDVLALREAPDPTPAPGEVLVEVRAIGVNFADIMARMGLYPEAPRTPFVPGYEFSGVVSASTPDTGLAVGTRVMGICRFGGYTTALAVPAAQLWPLPDALSFEEGAALPVSYITASLAIHRFGRVRRGEWVLIRSAAGGLGLAAVQLARLAGARLIGTAGAAKHARLKAAGVEHPIATGEPIRERVLEVTGGRGVDLVVNSTGGATVRTDLALLAPLGRIVLCGISTASPRSRLSLPRLLALLVGTPRPLLFTLMNRNIGVFGVNLGRLWSETGRLREDLAEVVAQVERGELRPTIDRVFGLADAAAAHRYIQDRRNIGKVLLAPDQPS